MLTYESLYEDRLMENFWDRSNDGLNVVNKNGVLVYVNKISANYAGRNQSEMIGNHISKYYPDAVLLNVLEDKHPRIDKEIHYVGKKKYVVSSYPIYKNGVFKGAFSIFKDIQEMDELNRKVKYLELHIKLNKPEDNFSAVIGNDGSLKDLLKKAKRTVGSLAGPRHSIIIGESGTGKTMLANIIYKYAKKVGVIDSTAPFIEINCGQFTNPDIAAMEIFGSEEGAYTGSKKKSGLFEQASGGILFLDEAHALKDYQTMLLKAIESGRIRRIGGNREIPVNVIIIAASTKNLKEEMLPELYQRLAQYELYIPSLRERDKQEKRNIFNHFVEKYINEVEKTHNLEYQVEFDEESKEILLNAYYPRNIRQFRDVVNYCIDSAAPLITDIGDNKKIKVEIKKEHIPFEIETEDINTGDIITYENKNIRKIKIDKECEHIIDRYRKMGYGPRKISHVLMDFNYKVEYYKIAYYLNKNKI